MENVTLTLPAIEANCLIELLERAACYLNHAEVNKIPFAGCPYITGEQCNQMAEIVRQALMLWTRGDT